MNKKEMDKLRSSVLYDNEILTVEYNGKFYEAKARSKKRSELNYPNPKWIACEYEITDDDGDTLPIARERYGEIRKGYKWVRSI